MGYIIKPKCQCLSTESDFYIGLGIRDFDKKYQNDLGYCPVCKRLDVTGEKSECQCGAKLSLVYSVEMVDEGVKTIQCPKCGGEMEIVFEGYWD